MNYINLPLHFNEEYHFLTTETESNNTDLVTGDFKIENTTDGFVVISCYARLCGFTINKSRIEYVNTRDTRSAIINEFGVFVNQYASINEFRPTIVNEMKKLAKIEYLIMRNDDRFELGVSNFYIHNETLYSIPEFSRITQSEESEDGLFIDIVHFDDLARPLTAYLSDRFKRKTIEAARIDPKCVVDLSIEENLVRITHKPNKSNEQTTRITSSRITIVTMKDNFHKFANVEITTDSSNELYELVWREALVECLTNFATYRMVGMRLVDSSVEVCYMEPNKSNPNVYNIGVMFSLKNE